MLNRMRASAPASRALRRITQSCLTQSTSSSSSPLSSSKSPASSWSPSAPSINTTRHINSHFQCHNRGFHTSAAAYRRVSNIAHNNEKVPESAPTTDFGKMDMLGQTEAPSTSIDVCLPDGFILNSGVRIDGGAGALLVGGEAFEWRPWEAAAAGEGKGEMKLVNKKGQWELQNPEEAFGLLGMVWPRPDLLILGVGPMNAPLGPETRRAISNLGIRVEVLDTRNASSQFNLLATERGVDNVAAALIPLGWKEGRGAQGAR